MTRESSSPFDVWQATASGFPDLWNAVGATFDDLSVGRCQAVFASSPAGDVVTPVWEKGSSPELLLDKGEGRMSALAAAPVRESDGGDVLVSIRLPGRQLGLAVFDGDVTDDAAGPNPALLAAAESAAAAIDRLGEARWRKLWERHAPPTGADPTAVILALLKVAVEVTGMDWGYVGSTAQDERLVQLVACVNNPAFTLDHFPSGFSIYRELRATGRAVVRETVDPQGRDRVDTDTSRFLRVKYGDRRQPFLKSVAAVRRCIAYPVTIDGHQTGVIALHHAKAGKVEVRGEDFLVLDHLARRLAVDLHTWEADRRGARPTADDAELLADLRSRSPREARDHLCTRLAEEACALCPSAYRAAVLMFIPGENTLIMAGQTKFWSAQRNRQPIHITREKALCVSAFARGETVFLDDRDPAQEYPDYLVDAPRDWPRDPTRSEVAIPIHSGQTVIGVLVVDSLLRFALRSGTEGPILNLVRQYAGLIARFHVVQHMDLLNTLIRDIGPHDLGEDHYRRFLKLAVEISAARHGTLFVRDPRTGTLDPVGRTLRDDELSREPGKGYRLGEGRTGTFAYERKVVRLDDAAEIRRAAADGDDHGPIDPVRRFFDDPNIGYDGERPIMYVPLVAGEEVVGLLRLRRSPGDPFTPIDAELAHQCATRFGEVIHHRFDLARTRALQSLMNALLDRRDRATDLVSVLETHVAWVLGECETEVWIPDRRPAAGGLRPVLRRVQKPTTDRGTHLDADAADLTARAWQTPDRVEKAGVTVPTGVTELHLPVLIEERVIGVVSVRKRVPHAFVAGEVRFLEQAAELTVRAIQRHRGERVNLIVQEFEKRLTQLLASTRVNGYKNWVQTESDFYLGVLAELEERLRARPGAGMVARYRADDTLEFLPREGAGTAMLQRPAQLPLAIRDAPGGCSAFQSAAVFAATVKVPHHCFVLRLGGPAAGERDLPQAVFFLFDEPDGQVSYDRLEELDTRLAVVAEPLAFARKQLRQQELDMKTSAIDILGAMLVNAHHDVRGPNERVVAALNSAIHGGRKLNLPSILDDALQTRAVLDELIDFLATPTGSMYHHLATDLFARAVADVTRARPAVARLFVVDPPVPAAVVVYGLGAPLLHMLKHLLTNALRAISGRDDGDVRVTAGMTAGGGCRLVVRDNGCGMTSAVQESMFEPFTKTRSEGTGLGMCAVYAIVRYHDGTIDIRSSPATGTTVTIHLPGM